MPQWLRHCKVKIVLLDLLLELPEFVQHFRGGERGLQEGSLFAAVLREVLEDLVEFRLVVLVDVEQESAELIFKVVHASKVIVTTLFVCLEELFAQVTAFESFVDGLGAEAAGAHCGCYAATGEGVGVVRRIADKGEVVERIIFKDA